MSAESVRAFLASAAPDLESVELPASSQTHTLSAAWGIRAAQIAKTLALSVGGRAVLAVVCGHWRLDNKKVKAVLGGKATMLAPEEAATITGHVLGGLCPFGLATPMPIYCDVQLRAFDHSREQEMSTRTIRTRTIACAVAMAGEAGRGSLEHRGSVPLFAVFLGICIRY